jgi:hypothetical protein
VPGSDPFLIVGQFPAFVEIVSKPVKNRPKRRFATKGVSLARQNRAKTCQKRAKNRKKTTVCDTKVSSFPATPSP